MGIAVENNSQEPTSEEERVTSATTSAGLPGSPPAVAMGPNTPDTAAVGSRRRKLSTEVAKFSNEDYGDNVTDLTYRDEKRALDLLDISQVQAFALSKNATVERSRMTLGRARARLERVKAMSLKRSEVGEDSAAFSQVRALTWSTRGRKPKVNVERARAKLKHVKAMKEKDLKNSERGDFHSSTVEDGIDQLPSRASRKASTAGSVNEEFPKEGAWVQRAKLRLQAAITKNSKLTSKRARQTPRKKTNTLEWRSSTGFFNIDGENSVGTSNGAESVKVTSDSAAFKEITTRRKTPVRKCVRTSERICQSRKQQRFGPELEREGGSAKDKTRSKRRKKDESCHGFVAEISGDVPKRRQEMGAANLERDRDLSPGFSADLTSSVEFTPPTKRRKAAQIFDETRTAVGARLASGVSYEPPVSSYSLIQEHLYQDPWKVLIACMLLNKTGGRQMHKVIWDFFKLCPDAETCISTATEKISDVIRSLGLQNKRARGLQRFSQDYLGTTWTNVTELYGIGEYARDAYAIFAKVDGRK